MADVLARHGRIDILVNGAGIVRPGSVETADPAAWREQIDINLLAAMYLSQGVLPGMRARRDGHIVTVSSTAGRYVGTRHSGYTASKHAVNAFCETLRQEVAELGIRVTIVEPGATTTEVHESIPDASDRAAMTQHITKQGNMRCRGCRQRDSVRTRAASQRQRARNLAGADGCRSLALRDDDPCLTTWTTVED